jgi:hypothetical protein
MYLRVVREYRARSITYPKGAVLRVTPSEARFFQLAAPGYFEVVETLRAPVIEGMDAPPADGMVRRQEVVTK